jgi:sulfonate transport system substrate-binding protein
MVYLRILGIALALGLTIAGFGARADDAAPAVLRIAAPQPTGADGQPRSGSSGGKALDDAIAQEFAGTGTKVEWVYFVNVGPGVNEAFAAKQVDFSLYGDFPAVIARSGGLKIKLLVPATRGTLESYLVVPADSTARSIADLKGKRISVNFGRPWMLAFEHLIAANGLKMSDFQIFNLVMPDGDAAVASHAVDAQYTLDGPQLQAVGKGKIIWSTLDAPIDWKFTTELFGREEFITQYPDATRRLVRAQIRAAAYYAVHPNEEYLTQSATFLAYPHDFLFNEWKQKSVKVALSPLLDDFISRHYAQVIDYAFDNKLIRRKFPVEELFDSSFDEAALRDLGLTNLWQPAPAAQSAEAQP